MKTTTMNRLLACFTLLSCAGVAGCGTARTADAYRTDTEKLLQTRNDQVQSCYDAALKSDRTLAGTVAVKFVVEKDTGVISQAAIDPANTSAPAALGQCVLNAVQGLKLDPGDRNEGHATFVYDFKPIPST